MGSRLGSGWLGRRRRRSMVNRTVSVVSAALRGVQTADVMVVNSSVLKKKKKGRILTGPMIVACQWNCENHKLVS
jgi:hypothetical protein